MAISIRKLGKDYPLRGGGLLTALLPTSLELAAGEFLCILGPSGCGKTTLLNILSGLDRDYRGEVAFAGGAQPTTGYIFQESRLLPWMSVKNNLRFVLDGRNGHKENDGHIEAWLARVGLAGYGDYYPAQLSIGMQQRVAVARALIIEPALLLMDEPFSSLDELTARRMRGELLELWTGRSASVVFVTHNPLEAVYLADRLAIMSPAPGRIVEVMDISARLPRPRNYEDAALWELSRQALASLLAADAGAAAQAR